MKTVSFLIFIIMMAGLRVGIHSETTPSAEGHSEAVEETEAEPEAEGGPELEGEPEAEGELEAVDHPESGPTSEDNSGEAEPEGGELYVQGIYITVYSLIIIFILASNIPIVVLILTRKDLRGNPNNLFLMSLVLARSFIGLFVVPAQITGMFSEEYLGSHLCKLCHFIAAGSATSSVFSIVAIALSKLATSGVYGSHGLTTKKTFAIIGLIWLFGFIYGIRAPVVYDIVHVTVGSITTPACTTSPSYAYLDKYMTILDVILLFVIPLFIILFCYVRVIHNLAQNAESADEKTRAEKENLRQIRMIVILLILFIFCSALPQVMKLYLLWGGLRFDGISVMQQVFLIISFSNAWFNVIVFWNFRNDLREGFKNMACRSCRKTPVKVMKVGPVPPAEKNPASFFIKDVGGMVAVNS